MADSSSNPATRPLWQRALAILRPSHRHTAFSATLLLMLSAFLSRIIGLVRDKCIAYLFGAGPKTDAYISAFNLPDQINYFLVGGTASIVFVTILSRYRERGEDAEGERAMAIILNAVLLVLGVAVVVAEVLAPLYTRTFFPGFSAAQAELCTHMTRILLPGQLFFFAGGVLGAVLLVRKQFAYQAVSPLVYNLAIIAGGLLLARLADISSLAIGATAGAVAGPFLLNAFGAYRAGVRYRPLLDLHHPALREWFRLSIPLMIGVSVVTVDVWILSYFASHGSGEITHLNYAKRLFMAPMAILGQAAGAASLPFFASIHGQQRLREFAAAVNESVTRIFAISFLLSAWMMGLAFPLVDIIYRGGLFHRQDASQTSLYFWIFAISLGLWSAQSIYARAFYAAGDTLSPMIVGTVVVLLSLPVYTSLYHAAGPVGLAVASDLAILVQTVALAVLLHRRGMVPLQGLEFWELGRSLLAGIVSLGVIYLLRRLVPAAGRIQDLLLVGAATAVWLLVAGLLLRITGSALPGQVLSRFRKSSV